MDSFVFAFAIGATFCYLECFITDLVYKNNRLENTGRNFFFLAVIMWGFYHYLSH
jgi:hypothetical protein